MLSPPGSTGMGVCGFCLSAVIGKSGDFTFHSLGGNVTPTPPEAAMLGSGPPSGLRIQEEEYA